MSSLALASCDEEQGFRHEAFFYDSTEAFLEGAASFIRGALGAGEEVFVVLSSRKIDLLRARLGPDLDGARFGDMDEIGSNPAHIIPAWAAFVGEHATRGRRVRGIGEPICPDRSASEMVECQVHERLVNVAFAGGPSWWLLCPYDTSALSEDVIAEACRSHRYLQAHGASHHNIDYSDSDQISTLSNSPLQEPSQVMCRLSFDAGSLHGLRRSVFQYAWDSGFTTTRAREAVTAVNEVATNSLVHAAGRGELQIWRDGETLVFDVSDDGHIDDPLVGRIFPDNQAAHGRGLWMANQLCDLVQVRSSCAGTVVRLHLLPR